MARLTIPAVVVVVGLVLLADLIVENPALGGLAGILVEGVVLVAAGAALGGAVALGLRRGSDLLRRSDERGGAVMVLLGMGAMLVVGLRPGADGADDPAVRWLVAALLVPLGAALFALLFVTTLGAMRRSVAIRQREAMVMLVAAAVVLVLLLPIAGGPGAWLAGAASWALAVPIGGVFRGLLLGVAVVTAVAAARTMLGVGVGDD
jgi:hypothetical protein